MKNIVISLSLLILSNLLFAQQKGDNTLIIKTDTTAEFNYTDFGKHLIKSGYTFEETDKNFLFIITSSKRSYDGDVEYKLHLSFVGNEIIIKPKVKLLTMALTADWFDWEYRKSNTNYFKKVYFDFMPNFSKYGKPVIFEKR